MAQNNYIGHSSIMSNAANNFDMPATSSSVLHHFDGLTKLFSDLYPTKFLHSTKP